MKPLPLELGSVSPGPGFAKMDLGKRPDGVTDGVHCGGVWLSPDESEVWKPLDAKPFVNATERYPTREAECLAEMTGQPGFPDNWRVEEQNGRRWLVRPRCYLWPQDKDLLIKPKLATFLMIESAIFALNTAGWEYNDLPQLAYDPTIHAWFLLDCSAAWKPDKWQNGWHGDRGRIDKWFGLLDLDGVKDLRQRGYHVYHAVQLPAFNDPAQEPYNVEDAFYPLSEEERRRHVHLYVSTLRPLSMWFKVDGTRILRGDLSKSPRVHSWVASDHPLDDETIKRFELTFAYRPWP